MSDILLQSIKHQSNHTSIHWPDERPSLNIARLAKSQVKSYFDNDLYEITKQNIDEIDNGNVFFESSIEISGNKIGLFEKPRDMIFINHIDNPRHLGIARELRETVRQSKLEFALEPYKDYLNFPEIEYYRQKGQLETTQTSIIIKNCSLILAFGMKRLVDDLNSCTVIPGFEMTNQDDYNVAQPKIKFISFSNSKYKQEYEYLRGKFKGEKASIHRLYNSVIFLKYNAIRYFYHVNSYYRDMEPDSDQVIEGTDMNIIYKEQIDDEIESLYSTHGWGRKVFKIINLTTSMIELWLNIASFDSGTTSILK